MIAPLFDIWERRLAAVDTSRVVLPFEWGLEWLDLPPDDPLATLKSFARQAVDSSRPTR
jgi:hypothetical protein